MEAREGRRRRRRCRISDLFVYIRSFFFTERGVRTLASMCACSSSTATSSDVEKMFVCIYNYIDTASLFDHTQPAAN